MPSFVNTQELEKLYLESDLSYNHVFGVCAKLQTITQSTIPLATIEAWYRLFLLDKWTKKRFNEQAKAVSQTKIFGAISYANWMEGIEVVPVEDVEIKLHDILDDYILVMRKVKHNLKQPYQEKFHKAAILKESVRRLQEEIRLQRSKEFDAEVIKRKSELETEAKAVSIEQLKSMFPELTEQTLTENLESYKKIYITRKYETL